VQPYYTHKIQHQLVAQEFCLLINTPTCCDLKCCQLQGASFSMRILYFNLYF